MTTENDKQANKQKKKKVGNITAFLVQYLRYIKSKETKIQRK